MIGTFALPGAGSHPSSSSPPRPGAEVLRRQPVILRRFQSSVPGAPCARGSTCRGPRPRTAHQMPGAGAERDRGHSRARGISVPLPPVTGGRPVTRGQVARAVRGGAFTDPQLPVRLPARSDQSAASSAPLPRFMSVRSSRRSFARVAGRKPDPQQAPRTRGLRFRPHRAALALTDPSHHSRSRTARQPGNTTACHAASRTGMFTACRGRFANSLGGNAEILTTLGGLQSRLCSGPAAWRAKISFRAGAGLVPP